jgi:hypothetical protein
MAPFELTEPIVAALVERLENELPAVLAAINAGVTDGYELRAPQLIIPQVPSVGTLRQWPTIGIQDLGLTFEDDIGSSFVAVAGLVVLVFEQSANLMELSWRLRRWERALVSILPKNRSLGPASDPDAYSVQPVRTIPGPTLGDSEDPKLVKTHVSWTGLELRCYREEDA